jgi:hypothetical protein
MAAKIADAKAGDVLAAALIAAKTADAKAGGGLADAKTAVAPRQTPSWWRPGKRQDCGGAMTDSENADDTALTIGGSLYRDARIKV